MNRPTSVTVFAILNLVFGVLGICGLGFSALMLFAPLGEPFNQPNPMLDQLNARPGYRAYTIVGLGLGFVASIAEIVAGVGMFSLRRWARTTSVVIAWYGIASTLLGVALNIYFMYPIVQQVNAKAGPEQLAVIGGMIGGVLGGCIGMIYPVLLLYFMTRPHVVAAFDASAAAADPRRTPSGPYETGNPYQSR